jgi:hypothetical protein
MLGNIKGKSMNLPTPEVLELVHSELRRLDPSIAAFVPKESIDAYQKYLAGEPWTRFVVNFLCYGKAALPFGVGMEIFSDAMPSEGAIKSMIGSAIQSLWVAVAHQKEN